jgi:hypothetical protein
MDATETRAGRSLPIEARHWVEYDPNALRKEFLETLDTFTTDLKRDNVEELIGADLIRQVLAQERAIRNRLETKFKLVVVGEFKRGKSMLINALLGAPVVTSDVTPETATINLIDYGPDLCITARLDDGGRVRLTPEDLRRDRLTTILRQLPGKFDHLEIEAPYSRLRGVTLVDTPGLGDLLAQFDVVVRDYLGQADALIYVTASWAPLSESEQKFLRLSVVPQSFPQILFAVNMMDAIQSDEEAARLLSHVRTKVARILPFAPVFAISALDEFCRCTGALPPNPTRTEALAGGFASLRGHLDGAILLNREIISLTRAAQLARQMADNLSEKVAILRSALESDHARLAACLTECEQAESALHKDFDEHKRVLAARVSELAEEAVAWMAEFLTRFEVDVLPRLELAGFDALRRHFHFFLVDRVRSAISEVLSTHQSAFVEIAETIGQTLSNRMQALSPYHGASLEIAQTTFTTSHWTNLDVLEFAEQFLSFGFSGLLSLVQFVSHDAEGAMHAKDFVARLRREWPTLRERIEDQVRAIYGAITTDILQQIETSFRKDLETNAAAMRQAQQLHSQGAARVEQAVALFSRIDCGMTSTRAFLERFVERVWRNDATCDSVI